MTISVWQEVPDPIRAEHDDVVIGAGIVGSYAATVLRARGRNVALVDAHFPAAGASGRNAGYVLTAQDMKYPALIRQVGRGAAREILAMVQENVRRMRELAGQHGVPIKDGAMYVAETRASARELEEWARELEADGVALEFARSDPYGAGYLASMQIEGNFVMNPATFTTAIAQASGATLYKHNEVYAIETNGERVVVRGRRAELRCHQVYVCTNAYAASLHPYFRHLTWPQRGEVVVTAPVAPAFPVAALADHYYFHQLLDGRLLIGGGSAFSLPLLQTTEDAFVPGARAGLQGYMRRWFPDLEFEITRRWVGARAMTQDRRVAVGSIPEQPRVAFAVGLSGYGNSIGLISAERMVELALDGRDPGPISAGRFA